MTWERSWMLAPSATAPLAGRLAALGFRSTGPDRWARGSVFSSWFGMDPRTWQVRVKATPGDAGVLVEVNVDAYGQIVTSSERVYWARELQRIEAAVHGESTLPVPVGTQGAIARVENWMLTALPLAVAVVAGGTMAVLGLPLAALMVATTTLIGLQLVLFGWARWRPLTADERLD